MDMQKNVVVTELTLGNHRAEDKRQKKLNKCAFGWISSNYDKLGPK